MTDNKSSIAKTAIFAVIATVTLSAIPASAAESDAMGANSVLAASGYTKIQVIDVAPKIQVNTAAQPQACPVGLDAFRTEFMATSAAGYRVGGFVCSAVKGGGLVIPQVVSQEGDKIMVRTDPAVIPPAK